MPASQHPYQYSLNSPIRFTNPSKRNLFPDTYPIPTRLTPLEGIYTSTMIAMAFLIGNPTARMAEYPVPGASERHPGVRWINGYADLVDFDRGEVYEVKSERFYRNQRSMVLRQLNRYVEELNRTSQRASDNRFYRPPPATGTWRRGTTFLKGQVQSFGLWPYGIDLTYNPKVDGYYEIKAKLSSDDGVIVYWGEPISTQRARVLTPQYQPEYVRDFIDDVYGDWRKPDWNKEDGPPRLYPGMNLRHPVYWCAVTGDMLLYYLEGLARVGEQLDPHGGMTPAPGPGVMPIPVVP